MDFAWVLPRRLNRISSLTVQWVGEERERTWVKRKSKLEFQRFAEVPAQLEGEEESDRLVDWRRGHGSFEVPPEAYPSFETTHSTRIQWCLEVLVARGRRRPIELKVPVLVSPPEFEPREVTELEEPSFDHRIGESDALRVAFDRPDLALRPGDHQVAEISWQFPEVPSRLEWNLYWEAGSEGRQATLGVFGEVLLGSEASGSTRVSWTAPAFPFSLEGRIVRVDWVFEVVAKTRQGETRVSVPVIISPDGTRVKWE